MSNCTVEQVVGLPEARRAQHQGFGSQPAVDICGGQVAPLAAAERGDDVVLGGDGVVLHVVAARPPRRRPASRGQRRRWVRRWSYQGRAPSRRHGRHALGCVVVPWVSVRQVVRSAPRRPLPWQASRPPDGFRLAALAVRMSESLTTLRCGAVADQVATRGLAAARTPRGCPDACGLSTTYRVASP
jgi:hypothetical protein